MRLIAVPAAFTGMGVIVAAAVGTFLKLDTIAIGGFGLALTTAAIGMKFAQKHEEVKNGNGA
tara:strand:- start:213 stop:398 length:186 start_codon:yes stop_codon:yes gene_type:complete